jgi:hypothetical protein
MQILRTLFVGSLVMLAWSGAAFAQTGTIQGTVTDATGAIVQGAEVTVRNVGSNTSRAVSSSSVGGYSLPDLPAGSYEISVKKAGFRQFVVPAAPLTVAQVLTIDAKLEPGSVTEEVQVQANQIQDIDPESSQLSNLVDQQQMEDLPLITRDPYSLVLLSPGTSQTDSTHGGFTVNGARDRNNNFLLDGVDNNDTSVPGGPFGVLAINPDSAQEFRVITDNFNAEFGRNTGAIIDVVTKSGSNQIHGGAYEFGRWNGFGGARDYFNPASEGPMNPYVRNQFGFSVGGPIIKNKTFFFFNDELDRFRTTLTNESTVPTAAFKSGQFNYTYIDPSTGQSNTIPVDLTATGVKQRVRHPPRSDHAEGLRALPEPDFTASADGIEGNLFYPSTSATNSYNATAKIDQHISDREWLSFRYGYDHAFDPNPGHSDFLPGNLGAYEEKAIERGFGRAIDLHSQQHHSQ